MNYVLNGNQEIQVPEFGSDFSLNCGPHEDDQVAFT